MPREPRPPNESDETAEDLVAAEVRAQICREYRRGLTMKNIAGGLGISLYKVQKVLDQDLKYIHDLSPRDHKVILGLPSGDAEKEAQKQELKERLKEQQEEARRSCPPPPPTPPPTENNPSRSPNNPHAITVFQVRPNSRYYYEQRREAFRLRKAGNTYDDIADKIGCSPQEAQKMVRGQLSEIHVDEYTDRELARRMHLERLDALMSAVWPSATRTPTEKFPDQGPDLEASRTALRILERQSKLLGLDSPAKIDISDRIRVIAERNGVDYEDMMQYVRESAKLKLAPTS